MKTPTELNHRMNQIRPGSYSAALRVWSIPATKRKMPRLRIKCGCCDEEVVIYHEKNLLEINGVNGTVENWREVLLPLLEIKTPAKRTEKKTSEHVLDGPRDLSWAYAAEVRAKTAKKEAKSPKTKRPSTAK